VIYSDLIPTGSADLIISMEPMEALRYLPYLASDGCVVTSAKPFINIPNYPSEEALMAELASLPNVVMLDIEEAARACGNPKGANMVLLGMAAPAIGILDADALRAAIGRVFARKGEAVVAANRKAFDLGLEAGLK
jgi:indolepyruvate ferredoxin oxidoreductase beta subunit